MVFLASMFCCLAAQEPPAAAPAAPAGISIPAAEIVAVDGATFPVRDLKLEGGQARGRRGMADWQAPLLDLVAIRLPAAKPTATAAAAEPLLVLASDELLRAKVLGLADDAVRVRHPALGDLAVPLTALQGIVLAADLPPGQTAELQQRIRGGKRKSDEAILRNRDVLVGNLAKLDDARVVLSGEPEQPIERGLVAAVALDPTLLDYKPPAGFYAQLRLQDGSLLSVLDLASQGSRLSGKTNFGPAVSLESSQVLEIAFRNGRVAYLSDLAPAEAAIVPYFDDAMPHRLDRNVLGGPLRVRGKEHAKGLGVRSGSTLRYDLAGGFAAFEAVAALDDLADAQASVRFVVEVDGKVAFDSGEVDRRSEPQPVRLALAGAKSLVLRVDYARRGDVQDFADWASARLLR